VDGSYLWLDCAESTNPTLKPIPSLRVKAAPNQSIERECASLAREIVREGQILFAGTGRPWTSGQCAYRTQRHRKHHSSGHSFSAHLGGSLATSTMFGLSALP
jgi:hypothetical protein